MPLQLPNLDDRTYDDLLAEALALIPALSPEWTNHNPSDPGITLVELFAYLSDILIYRLNRVTDANIRKFLKLLNGPDWVEPANADLRQEIRLAVLQIRERYRAVTREDFEILSTVDFNQSLTQSSSTLPQVARAHCVPQRNLDAGNEAERLLVRQDHVSVVILPAGDKDPNPQPGQDLVDALFAFLDERRILTTRLHVAGPVYAPVEAELVIARKTDVLESDLRPVITQTLSDLLNPLASGDNQGWPFGRDVFVSLIYDVLEQIPGIDFITDVMLSSQAKPNDDRSVSADQIWHESGDLVGLRIQQHHLPIYDSANVVIAPSGNFVTVNLVVTAKANADPSTLRRAIKAVLRDLLHPAHHGPGPQTGQATQVFISDLTAAIQRVQGVLAPVAVVGSTVPASALQQDQQRGPYINVDAAHVLDWRVQVEFS
jgi:hypothetical protein